MAGLQTCPSSRARAQVSQQGSFTFGWQLRDHLPLEGLLPRRDKPGSQPTQTADASVVAQTELQEAWQRTVAASSFAVAYSPPRPSAGTPLWPHVAGYPEAGAVAPVRAMDSDKALEQRRLVVTTCTIQGGQAQGGPASSCASDTRPPGACPDTGLLRPSLQGSARPGRAGGGRFVAAIEVQEQRRLVVSFLHHLALQRRCRNYFEDVRGAPPLGRLAAVPGSMRAAGAVSFCIWWCAQCGRT